MPRGERRARAAQDHHADRVVRFGEFERRAQLDEHPAVLRVALLRAIERDDGDPAVVDDLVADVVEILHGWLPSRSGLGRTACFDPRVDDLREITRQ